MKLILVIMTILLLSVVSVNAQVSVIVNKSVHETTLNTNTLANIYTLTTSKWKNGGKIVLFDAFAKDIKNTVCKYISKDPFSLKREWLKKQLTGAAKVPKSIKSDDEMISKVASTPGAIGFVKSSNVTGDVKVLLEIK